MIKKGDKSSTPWIVGGYGCPEIKKSNNKGEKKKCIF